MLLSVSILVSVRRIWCSAQPSSSSVERSFGTPAHGKTVKDSWMTGGESVTVPADKAPAGTTATSTTVANVALTRTDKKRVSMSFSGSFNAGLSSSIH